MTDRTNDPTNDVLSAYLDGELSTDEARAIEADIAADSAMAAEVASLREMRGMIRALPDVEPPAGFLDALKSGVSAELSTVSADEHPSDSRAEVASLDERRNRKLGRRLGSGIAAVAACWLLLVGLAPGIGELAPPLDDYVNASASADTLGFDAMGMDDMEMDELVMPPEMAGMSRMGLYQRGDTRRADYQSGASTVSIYQDEGVIDWDALPMEDAEIVMMDDDAPMWVGHIGEHVVAVLEHDNTVITVVSTGMDDVMHVSHDLPHEPSTSPGLLDRTKDGLDRVVGWVS